MQISVVVVVVVVVVAVQEARAGRNDMIVVVVVAMVGHHQTASSKITFFLLFYELRDEERRDDIGSRGFPIRETGLASLLRFHQINIAEESTFSFIQVEYQEQPDISLTSLSSCSRDRDLVLSNSDPF